jgi:hypothetical protein
MSLYMRMITLYTVRMQSFPRLLAVFLIGIGSRGAFAAESSVAITLGEPQTVLADGQYGLHYFPDERLAVISEKSDSRVFMAAGVGSVLLEGRSMNLLGPPREVLQPGKPGTFDNGYAGISGVWRAASGELLAIYHAEDHEGIKGNAAGIPGFYCRVALAVSRNDGQSFEKLGPIVAGQQPKVQDGRFDQGIGEPGLVAEPGGKFLYVYYSSHERLGGSGVHIGLARCPVEEAMQPGSWRKFHGGSFPEPGLGGRDTPVMTPTIPRADALFPHVVHVPALRQFVMVYCVNAWNEQKNPGVTGFYAAFSADGIHWPREAIRQIWKTPVIAELHHPVAWHPTLILDNPTAKNEIKGWLYYGYSESWGHHPPDKPHYLVRRPITFATSSVEKN